MFEDLERLEEFCDRVVPRLERPKVPQSGRRRTAGTIRRAFARAVMRFQKLAGVGLAKSGRGVVLRHRGFLAAPVGGCLPTEPPPDRAAAGGGALPESSFARVMLPPCALVRLGQDGGPQTVPEGQVVAATEFAARAQPNGSGVNTASCAATGRSGSKGPSATRREAPAGENGRPDGAVFRPRRPLGGVFGRDRGSCEVPAGVVLLLLAASYAAWWAAAWPWLRTGMK